MDFKKYRKFLKPGYSPETETEYDIESIRQELEFIPNEEQYLKEVALFTDLPDIKGELVDEDLENIPDIEKFIANKEIEKNPKYKDKELIIEISKPTDPHSKIKYTVYEKIPEMPVFRTKKLDAFLLRIDEAEQATIDVFNSRIWTCKDEQELRLFMKLFINDALQLRQTFSVRAKFAESMKKISHKKPYLSNKAIYIILAQSIMTGPLYLYKNHYEFLSDEYKSILPQLIVFKDEGKLFDHPVNLPYSPFNFLHDLELDNSKKQVEHEANKKTVENKPLLSFGCQISRDMLTRIYYMPLDKNDFVDKDATTLDGFINVLTARDVFSVQGGIRFDCESRQVAYILRKLEEYFKNLSFSNIGKSGRFFSKNGSILQADSLSKYISAGKEIKEKETIDSFFLSLKSKQ